MGFRLQRRAKLFGGLGVNLSKSGLSWSIRTPVGSIGPKGYSIRTGLKGLTYREGFKKGKRINKPDPSPSVSRNRNSNTNNASYPFVFIIIAILFISVVAVLYSSNAFDSQNTVFGIFIFLFILSIILILFYKRKPDDNNRLETDNSNISVLSDGSNDLEDNSANGYSGAYKGATHLKYNSGVIKEERINLEKDVILFIENLCNEICDILDEAKLETGITERVETIQESLKMLAIYDLCKVFSYLDISITENKIERDVLLVATGCFFEPPTDSDLLNNNLKVYIHFVELIDSFIYKPFPLMDEIGPGPFVVLELLRPYRHLFNTYRSKLSEFASLITTIDHNLTKGETKILDLIRNT